MPAVPPPESKRKGSSRLLKVLLWGAGIAGLLVATLIALVILTVSRLPSKAYHPHPDTDPVAADEPAEPILQLEDHTCGFLSLAVAYAKYGMSAEDENLRFRLGVDRPANLLDASTTGTLHPDMFRVLKQDHFDYRLLDPASPEALTALREHFSHGNAVLLLIARRENGNLHWVMSDGLRDQELRIVDSLRETAYPEPAAPFIRDQVLSIVAIQPATTDSPRDLKPHADGLAELAAVRSRLAGRGSPQ